MCHGARPPRQVEGSPVRSDRPEPRSPAAGRRDALIADISNHLPKVRVHVGAINCPASPPLLPAAKISSAPFLSASTITKSYVTGPVGSEKFIFATPVPPGRTE